MFDESKSEVLCCRTVYCNLQVNAVITLKTVLEFQKFDHLKEDYGHDAVEGGF